MKLTCEQVKQLREQEKQRQLKHFEPVEDYSKVYYARDFMNALTGLQAWHVLGKCNLVGKLRLKKLLMENDMIWHLKEVADFGLMSDDKLVMGAAYAAKATPQNCFYNSFMTAVKLSRHKQNVKMVAGIATVPIIDLFGTPHNYNFTHAVIQVDHYVYDFNYNLRLNAEDYYKLFGFEKLCIVNGADCAKQCKIIASARKDGVTMGEFNNTIYIALANEDFMQKLAEKIAEKTADCEQKFQ